MTYDGFHVGYHYTRVLAYGPESAHLLGGPSVQPGVASLALLRSRIEKLCCGPIEEEDIFPVES